LSSSKKCAALRGGDGETEIGESGNSVRNEEKRSKGTLETQKKKTPPVPIQKIPLGAREKE